MLPTLFLCNIIVIQLGLLPRNGSSVATWRVRKQWWDTYNPALLHHLCWSDSGVATGVFTQWLQDRLRKEEEGSSSEEDQPSAYEHVRQENMLKNAARLAELGLAGGSLLDM